jgi:protein-tyrosine phosphatase
MAVPRERVVRRTSITHPMLVSWVDWDGGPAGGHTAGRLGLAMAPGARCAIPGGQDIWERSLDLDMAAMKRAGVTRLVCLLEDSEFALLGLDDYPEVAAAAGLPFLRLPIPLHAIPGDGTDGGPTRAELVRLVGSVAESLSEGEHIVVHCRGGLGRTGLVAGCVLRTLGYDSRHALEVLAATRGDGCPETDAQREAIVTFSA